MSTLAQERLNLLPSADPARGSSYEESDEKEYDISGGFEIDKISAGAYDFIGNVFTGSGDSWLIHYVSFYETISLETQFTISIRIAANRIQHTPTRTADLPVGW